MKRLMIAIALFVSVLFIENSQASEGYDYNFFAGGEIVTKSGAEISECKIRDNGDFVFKSGDNNVLVFIKSYKGPGAYDSHISSLRDMKSWITVTTPYLTANVGTTCEIRINSDSGNTIQGGARCYNMKSNSGSGEARVNFSCAY